VRFLRQLLAFSGLEEDRLRVKWISSAEGPKFADEMKEFVATLKTLGPSPLSHHKAGKRAA
jgi:F420-non-reducing hydrogenase iron-sulfur subunit